MRLKLRKMFCGLDREYASRPLHGQYPVWIFLSPKQLKKILKQASSPRRTPLQVSSAEHVQKSTRWVLFCTCSAAWTRTKDPPVNSGTLYQLSYRGMFCPQIETRTILADFIRLATCLSDCTNPFDGGRCEAPVSIETKL